MREKCKNIQILQLPSSKRHIKMFLKKYGSPRMPNMTAHKQKKEKKKKGKERKKSCEY